MSRRVSEHDAFDHARRHGAPCYFTDGRRFDAEARRNATLSKPINGTCSATLRTAASGDFPEFGIRDAVEDIQSCAPVGGLPKRALDIFIAVVSIVLLSPLMIVVVGMIRLTMGSPVLFAHTRIGYDGQPFRCYKFGTMVVNADASLADHLKGNPDAALEWNECRKLRYDPRITILGYLLRKSSIDELPQLFNVLRGEMSCVGPRPVVDDELQRYGAFLVEYLKARPGLTGLWQTSGRNKVDYERRVALDCHYVRNWSIWLDARILVKTIFVLANFDESA
jgi:lipopolysaccharide/colanic/teichoic acid biosynthesis glycosyltransferase